MAVVSLGLAVVSINVAINGRGSFDCDGYLTCEMSVRRISGVCVTANGAADRTFHSSRSLCTWHPSHALESRPETLPCLSHGHSLNL